MAKGKSKRQPTGKRGEFATTDTGGAVGSPRIEFDLKAVEELASIQCTQGEMAAVLGVSRDTVVDRIREDANFSAAYERGREKGRESLRRVQWKLAQRGHPTMLIWLGKQYLKQRDRFDVQISDSDLARMTEEQLARLVKGEDPAVVAALEADAAAGEPLPVQ